VRALIVMILLALGGLAQATPSQDLAKAREHFRNGRFEQALEKYNALLYPFPQLASADDLADAYIALGVCRFETGDNPGAVREFQRALQIDQNRQLDPLVVTNKKAIELFDDTKTEIRIRAEREAARKREAEERERLRKIKASLIGVRDNPYAYNFLPFGVGQFQNGQRAKGAFFLGTELLTVGTSIGIWGYLVNKYGIRSTQVPLEDGPRVRLLQQIEIGTGVAFFGLYVWGVIDANLNYKRQVRTEIDESLLPPELRDIDKKPAAKEKPKKTSFLRRLHVTPMLSPDSAGIGIGWEND
jgi:tetratricopeptide (TPR) repeat protein